MVGISDQPPSPIAPLDQEREELPGNLPVTTCHHDVHGSESMPLRFPAVARVGALTGLALPLLAGALVAAHGPGSGGADPSAAGPPLPGTAGTGVYPALRGMQDLALPTIREHDAGVGLYPALRRPGRLVFPSRAAIDAARRWAGTRQGRVSFAVADHAGVTGLHEDDPYPSASLVKAMLLVAFLDRLERESAQISSRDAFRIDAMIRVSDNDSATAIFRRLGPEALRTLAHRAGMKSFAIGRSWSEARVTAADQAVFFLNLDRLLPPGRRPLARYLLSSVEPLQSWGVPEAARPRWQVLFKGGWRPDGDGQLVHQAALMERGRRRVAVAVLTEDNPSEEYGHVTIRGIAERLLRRPLTDRAPAPSAYPGRLAPLRELDGHPAPEPRPLQSFSS
jgi:beta-lactamase class A